MTKPKIETLLSRAQIDAKESFMNVRLRVDLKRSLVRLATEHGVSLSKLVEVALLEFLKDAYKKD